MSWNDYIDDSCPNYWDPEDACYKIYKKKCCNIVDETFQLYVPMEL